MVMTRAISNELAYTGMMSRVSGRLADWGAAAPVRSRSIEAVLVDIFPPENDDLLDTD
jgi:hypothetical protein